MNYLLSMLITIEVLPSICCGARILALMHLNSRSHFSVYEPLLLALQERGHEINVVSSFPRKEPLENYTDIDFSSEFPPPTSNVSLQYMKQVVPNLFKAVFSFIEHHLVISEKVMKNDKVLDLLNEKFDLVLGEIFGADCLNYIAHKLKAPVISWVCSTTLPWVSDDYGLPDNPAYIPNFYMNYEPEMNYFERLYNTISLVFAKVVYYYYSELPSHKITEHVLREKLPYMSEINRQTSLLFVNSHFTLSQSRPFPPNVIEVGGIHINDPRPLPQDIKAFLDSAKDGAILFSLGSLLRTASLPPQTIRMFLDVFAILSQKIIFKYEEDLHEVPSNVILKKWLPQSDILAHPNIRVVISHGGQASTMEAVHFGKPLIAIPIFGDQFKNAKNIVCRGAGILLDLENLSELSISQGLKAVLDDPTYTANMMRLSQLFRDRPMTPLQTAVYWTEYVIRHQGAPHLRPASVNLPLYQYLLLDVIAVLAVLLIAVFFILYYLVNHILRRKRLAVYIKKGNMKFKAN
ncbi:UDP-glucosyltransferase 2-like isoform X1 [Homalodisca vitripennis]|uniref:UDP-glucosyltransferase 2-like isoform X1 n=1 Tax=Homalodisca vitripennis TaxID=197043 RepID=UPI001EEC2848|nr:UDP-glucosyltransferase 2-like isoform X1 [Homalodisca vitripennis]